MLPGVNVSELSFGQKELAGFVQHDLSGGPVKELGTQRFLQLADGAGDGRLSGGEAFRGFRDAFLFTNGFSGLIKHTQNIP